MTWVAAAIGGSALVGAGGSIFSGLMGGKAANKAAQASADAMNNATNFARTVYGETRTALDPFRATGTSAIGQIGDIISGKANVSDLLSNDPMYKWQLEESQRMNERGLSRMGLQNSGAGLELNRRTLAKLTGDTSQRYFQNLYNVAQLGENAAAMQGQAGSAASGQVGSIQTQGASNVGQAYMNQGVAYGNIGTGVANAAQSGVGTTLNYNLYTKLIERLGNGSGQNPIINGPGSSANQWATLGLTQ